MNSSDKNYSIKSDSVEQKKDSDAHPDISDLCLLSSSNKDSFSDNDSLILHVAECLQCQKLLTVFTSLNQKYHTLDKTTVSEVQQMLIVDYVSRGFSVSRKKLLREKIHDEPSTLKAMLHYASHSEAMRRGLSIKEDGLRQKSSHTKCLTIEKTKFNVFSRISCLLMKFKIPFKWSLSFNFSTIYSVFVSCVSISLLFFILSNKLKPVEIDVIEVSSKLDSNNRVELEFISRELSGSNFIYAVEPDTEASADKEQGQKNQGQIKNKRGKVTIRLNEKEALHIAWPVSGETNRYMLSFYTSSNRTKKPELSLSTNRDFIELDITNFESKKRYRWVFSYQTIDEKTFRAEGGFVIKPSSSEN